MICLRCIRFLQKLKGFRVNCIESNKYFEELERIDVLEVPVDVQKITNERLKIKVEPLSLMCDDAKGDELASDRDDEENFEIEKMNQTSIKLKKRKKIKETDNIGQKANADDFFNESMPPPVPSEMFVCPICSKTFTNKYYLTTHKKTHQEGKLECHFCSEKFRRKQYLASHILARHIEKDFGRTGDYICDICQKRYLNSFRLERHKTIHARNLAPCPICAKMIKNMTCHIKTHANTGERFQCDQCGKNYKAQKDLASHKIIHENRSFACEVCGKEFNQPSKVQQHMRIHKPDRPTFPCHHCNHHFTFRTALLEHLRSYSGERRFICNICSFAFKKASALKKHMHTHYGTKPYMCGQCNYGTKKKSEYLEHLKVKHPQEETMKV